MKNRPLGYVGLVGVLLTVLGCVASAQDRSYDPKQVQFVNGRDLAKLLDLPKDTVLLVAITKDENTRKYFVPQGANFSPVKIVKLPLNIGKTENLEILELKPGTGLTRLRFRRNPLCDLWCDPMLGGSFCFYPCEE